MIENMLFDRNRTEFESGKAKEIWQFGIHIVPLAVSLADVQDAETREGCRQVYACIMEILTDMAVHTTEYTYGPRWRRFAITVRSTLPVSSSVTRAERMVCQVKYNGVSAYSVGVSKRVKIGVVKKAKTRAPS